MATFNPSVNLKSYIAKIDDLATKLDFDINKNLAFLGGLGNDDFFKNNDILRTGCRVWVRYLNNVDLDVQTNILFVKQEANNEHGIRGKRFWELISYVDNILGSAVPNQSVDLMPYLAKFVPNGSAVIAIAGYLSDTSVKVKTVQDLIVVDINALLDCFKKFIDDFKAEYEFQNPVSKKVTEIVPQNESNTGTGTGTGTPPKTGTQSGILDIVTTNYQYIILALFLVGLWWYFKK